MHGLSCWYADIMRIQTIHRPHRFTTRFSWFSVLSALFALLGAAPARASHVAGDREVSLLALYTREAVLEAGGEHELHGEIRDAIARLNASFVASCVDGSVRFAGGFATDYPEGDAYRAMLEDLRRGWRDPASGGVQPADASLVDLRCARDMQGADLVTLIVAAEGGDGVDGIADQLQSFVGDTSLAFSVVRRTSMIERAELAHQIGHNLGADHEDALSLLAASQAHEFNTQAYGTLQTLMWSSHDGASALAQFSNPDVLFDGEPTGVALKADNAGVINAAIGAVAAYRSDAPAVRMMWSARRDDAFGASVAAVGRSIAIGRPEFFDDNHGFVDLFTLHGEEDGGECGIAPVKPFNPDDADAWTGRWLDASGDRVLAGGAGDVGAAYVLAREPGMQWQTEALLLDTDVNPYNFATAGAIDGDTAIIQEASERFHPGILHFYAFDGDAWSKGQSLTLPGLFQNPVSSQIEIDILDDRAAVGVSVDGQIAGVITLVRESSGEWVLEQDIACISCNGLPGFRDVALGGSRLAVSHRLGVDVYVERANGVPGARWAAEQTLSDPRVRVGGPVAIGRDVIVMGDPGAGGDLRGGVFVWAWYDASGSWVIEDLILGEPGERLGRAVALNGPWIVASTHPDGVRAFYRARASSPPRVWCAADVDRDGDADSEDFFAFLDAFGDADIGICDLDGDGDCDAEDFFLLLELVGVGC